MSKRMISNTLDYPRMKIAVALEQSRSDCFAIGCGECLRL